ncbi:MAG: hypothetical protein HUU01_07720 [Saprospiraceae bacterium]|nr:hypothetical protein [Saprospiraceae bacterium]
MNEVNPSLSVLRATLAPFAGNSLLQRALRVREKYKETGRVFKSIRCQATEARTFLLIRSSLICCCFLAFGSCQNNRQSDVANPENALTVKMDQTPLRDSPGENGKVLKELEKGTPLLDLDEVSDFLTRLTVQGQSLYEPWLKVEAGEVKGWVYAAAIDFGRDTTLLAVKRFQALLGKALSGQATQWREGFETIRTQGELAESYLKGRALRDSITGRLPEGDGTVPPPDLFWIKPLLPAFEPQLVAEGTAYYLFVDFEKWLKKASRTPEREDDAFFQFCTQVFPEDSIEYFYPAWFMQTWDYGGSSLLGRGIHLKLLAAANRLCTMNTPFRSEILRMKTEMINDITQEGVEYWEQPEKIIKELDSILESKFEILNDADRIALSTRRLHFEEPAAHGIKTGLGSGSVN